MIFRHYAAPVLSFLFAGLIVFISLWNFTRDLEFELWAMAFYLVFAIHYRKLPDIAFTFLILAAVNIAINLMFVFTVNGFYWRLPFYVAVLAVLYFTYSDWLHGIVAAYLLAGVGAECYWFYHGQTGPEIYFYYFKVSVYLLAQFAFVYRPFAVAHYFKIPANPLSIDMYCRSIFTLLIALDLLMITEYLLVIFGHELFELRIPVIYWHWYIYVNQTISLFLLWLLVHTAIKLKNKNNLVV